MPTAQAAPEIASALRALHDESVRYWSSFDTPGFFAPIGDAWSPADNVRHLTKTMRAIDRGLNAPRWILWLRFGRGGVSRSYTEMKDVYLARLARGASAGRFAPGPAQQTSDAERERIMKFHADAIAALTASVGRWPESALDARRLPHPLLGPITVREMLFFTLYHNRHHLEGVQRRVGNSKT
jgi:hypothetical protein